MCLSAHHHNRRSYTGGLQVFKQSEAIATRHDDIAQNYVEGLSESQFQRAACVVTHHGFVARAAECARQRSQRIGLVVHDQYVCFGGHDRASLELGREMTKSVPPLRLLSTAIEPAWFAITDCTIARPSPVPGCLV